MDESEKELLRSRLFDLCELTICNEGLLNLFLQKRILTQAEIEDIISKTNNFAKATKLYTIIPKRVGAFYALFKGLAATNQDSAILILDEVREDDKEMPIIKDAQMKVKNWMKENSLASKVTLSSSLSISEIKSGITFDLYPPVHNFIGRADELLKLHEIVLRSKESRRISVISQLTSISGLGGIGKTQLAREYVSVHENDFDNNIIWMNADSEKNLIDSFWRLSKEVLHLSISDGHGKEKPVEVLAQEVYKYFEESKVLFILDNAEKVPWLKRFLPKSAKINPNLHVLITSRDKEWDRGIEVFELGGLSEEDAVTLVQEELTIDKKDKELMEDAHELVNTLQCFPLALQQAVAYIREQRLTDPYSIQDYLVEFETKRLELLSFREENTIYGGTFEATTATTWKITMDKIKQDPKYKLIATQIMNIIAYLNPDNISRDIFYELPSNFSKFEEKVNPDLVKEAVRLLVRYSMLNGRKNQRVLSVHRLVQAVTRSKLASDRMEEKVLNFTLKIFSDPNILVGFASHSMSVWRHAWKYKQLSKSHAWQVGCILCCGCNVNYQGQGIKFAKEAIERFKKYFGKNNPFGYALERYIARNYNDQGFYKKSLKILNKLLENITNVYKEKQVQLLATVEVLDDKGVALRGLEEYDEAIQVQERALQLASGLSDGTNRILPNVKTNYAVVLMESGRNKEALEIFQNLRKLYISNGDKNNVNLLSIQMYMAQLKERENKNEEAELLYKNTLETFAPTWTTDATLYVSLCCGLGNLLIRLKRYDEALEILEESLQKIRNELGDQHYRTLSLMSYIANARHYKGELELALSIHEKVHTGFLEIFGKDSTDREVLAERLNYAVLLSKVGHREKSFQMFRQNFVKIKALSKFDIEVFQRKFKYALAIEKSKENLQFALTLLNDVTAAYHIELQTKPGDPSLLLKLFEAQTVIERIKRKLANGSNKSEN